MRLCDINIRDPYILPLNGHYYLYGTRSETAFIGQAFGPALSKHLPERASCPAPSPVPKGQIFPGAIRFAKIEYAPLIQPYPCGNPSRAKAVSLIKFTYYLLSMISLTSWIKRVGRRARPRISRYWF